MLPDSVAVPCARFMGVRAGSSATTSTESVIGKGLAIRRPLNGGIHQRMR